MNRSHLPRLLLPLGLGVLGAWLTPPRGDAFAPAPGYKDWGKEFKNSVGMKLVRIPPGKFRMGSPAGEAERKAHEGPVHEVEITRPFYLGAFEVTQAEYLKVTKTNPSYYTAARRGAAKGADTSNLPVERVTSDEAVAFCNKLSALPAEKKAGRVYRLPTEAEWEYACRAGTTTTFHTGDKLLPAHAYFRTGPHASRTVPVGSYKPNAWGLYDMHGNVQEMVADWYGADYYKTSPRQGPTGPAAGKARVARGGSYVHWDFNCRAAAREAVLPEEARQSYLGFRVACSSFKVK